MISKDGGGEVGGLIVEEADGDWGSIEKQEEKLEKEVSEARCGVCTCAASHLCHLHLGLVL